MKKFLFFIAAGLILSACNYSSSSTPQANPVAQVNTNQASPSDNIYLTKTSANGNYMADFSGKTLYTFDKDTSGVSNCTGGCLTTWPPYTSGATAQGTLPANITVITRTDGSTQFAWMGKPLYYFSGDQAVGDMKGDGINGIWHIVKL